MLVTAGCLHGQGYAASIPAPSLSQIGLPPEPRRTLRLQTLNLGIYSCEIRISLTI